ncbi:MAG: pantoate--beta-alanine ligase [Planctomycetes bacterium]|nr:pantoate--beta-alanine ligase [Planctomycetota bacterium]MBL7145205.1 pantoate--beta-alanine ligase [Phycisphaerae bacterium]
MEAAETIQSIRSLIKAARDSGKNIGLVPTMGALHVGHISLIEAARKKCDYVVVSIFVNPTQFVPGEDFEKYPRPLEDDLDICQKAGVDAVFAPAQGEMYPVENVTWVNVEKLTESLCGQFRPGHFQGVTTVCSKLFNIVAPDIAFFGQKDAQQAIVIRRMAADLNMSLSIVVCPTIRESNGLAVSSRNMYLSEEQKKDAANIYKSLQKCHRMIDTGVKDASEIIDEMRNILLKVPSIEIEYISIVDADTLQSIDHITGKVLIAVAVRIGRARLIDNILLDSTK